MAQYTKSLNAALLRYLRTKFSYRKVSFYIIRFQIPFKTAADSTLKKKGWRAKNEKQVTPWKGCFAGNGLAQMTYKTDKWRFLKCLAKMPEPLSNEEEKAENLLQQEASALPSCKPDYQPSFTTSGYIKVYGT